MRQFSDKEIDLCQEIAEIYRKPMKHGDYLRFKYILKEPVLYDTSPDNSIDEYEYAEFGIYSATKPHWFPLWQEHDCISFLREKKWCIELSYICEPKIVVSYVQPKEESRRIKFDDNDTVLEALLKAVLEIMRQKK